MKTSHLVHFFLFAFLGFSVAFPERCAAEAKSEAESWEWHDVAAFPRHGQGWADTESPFDRFPAKARDLVRPAVWALAKDSAGVYVQFITDAPAIKARWKLSRERLEMWHMAATGVSGLDLYLKDDSRWRWAGVGRAASFPENESSLLISTTDKAREFRLYLPLYNGVVSLEIGIPADASIQPVGPPEDQAPVVVYGTSITQGACASRPGMAYPAMLGRFLDREVINLGFSGNGKTEPEVGGLLAELDPAVFVIDSLPNLASEEVCERVKDFVRILRKSRPETPIVLVESVTYTDADFRPARKVRVENSNRALRQTFSDLKESGYQDLHYVSTEALLGSDGEDTVDGVHPTDLGLLRIAEGLRPVLREILEGRAK